MLHPVREAAIRARLARLLEVENDAGVGGYELIRRLQGMLARERRRDTDAGGWRYPESITSEDVVDGLLLLERFRELELAYVERQLIGAALDLGLSWRELGVVYGLRSKQAMQQRYRRLGGTTRKAEGRPARPPARD